VLTEEEVDRCTAPWIQLIVDVGLELVLAHVLS
jgi:hypothetical protein